MKSHALKAIPIYVLFALGTANALPLEYKGGTNAVEDATAQITDDLYVGRYDGNNALTMTNGATITAETGYIGEYSSDNALTITGTNSAIRVTNVLYIGPNEGAGNTVNIDNGGQLNVGSATGMDGAIRIGSTNDNVGMTIANASIVSAESLYVGTAADESGFLTLSGEETEFTVDEAFIGLFGSNNVVTVNEGSVFTVSNLLHVGSSSTSNNTLTIAGETVIVDQVVVENPGENKIIIDDGGKLTYTGDANLNDAEDNGFNFEKGSTLEIGGTLTFSKMDSGVSVILNNNLNAAATSTWDTASGELYVGDETAGNQLTLLGGAKVFANGSAAHIGEKSNNNLVTVDGSNSLFEVNEQLLLGVTGSGNGLMISSNGSAVVGSDLWIGVQSTAQNNFVEITGTNSGLHVKGSVEISRNNGFNNGIALYDRSAMHVEQDFSLFEGAYLEMHDAATVKIDGDYMQYDGSELQITLGESSAGITNLAVLGDASFASNATIRISNDGTLGSTNIIQQTIVSAGGLWAGTNLTTELTTEILNGTNMVNFVNGLTALSGAIVTNDSIVLLVSTRTIAESSELVGTSLEPLADEIDAMAIAGNSNAIEQISILDSFGLDDGKRNQAMLDYYDDKESSTPAHNVINLGVQNVADQLTQRADNTRYRQGMASAQSNLEKPEGASGPHEPEQALQGWINGYGSKGSLSARDGYKGYDSSLNGFMVGLDASIRENWLIGFAGGTSRGDIDRGDSNTDTKSIYGAGYASVGTKDWFADMAFIYGNHDVNSTLGSAFDTKADYTAQTMSFYAGGGKEIATDYLIYTPQLSFLGNFYGQESYQEKSSNAVAREIEKFNTFLLQSSLGGSIGYYSSIGNVTFKPEIRAFWQHEWLGDEEKLNYTLLGGTGGQYDLLLQAPEKDILKLGIGSSAKIGEYLELRADLDTRLGSDYSDYTFLGSLRYQF